MNHLKSCVLAALAALPACSDPGEASADARLQIAVIPKGTTHEFWKSIHRGAENAARELGADIIWKGPLEENDRAQQIQVVQQFVTQGVDGIVLAPLDDKALVRPVAAARQRDIPVVIMDSALDGVAGEDFASFVATDNTEGGRMGGRELARLLDGRGKVVLMRYQVGSASTTNRERGFLEVIGLHPEIEVVSSDQFAGSSSESAKTKALNMIDTIKAADGVFCPNESSTVGMLLALRQEGLAGKVRFVGFDASRPLVDALRAGNIDALVVQDPVNMGYLATRTVVEQIRGAAVEPKIDTAITVATPANMDAPEIRRLLQ